ncbi:glycosyltransferase [candidate division FCPU426 bacterium]|nr:glycosyltransferase [candidate division FCPU426 bacterium]
MTGGAQNKGPVPIVFVNYHGTIGGGQVHLLSLLDGLNRDHFAPYVVCCQEGHFTERLRDCGFKPEIIPFGKGKLRYLHVSLPAIWKFFKYMKRVSAALVHVSGLQEAKLAAYACAWAKVPMVWLVAP